MARTSALWLACAAFAFLLAACSKKTCEEACDCADSLTYDMYSANIDLEECVADCREDYKEDDDCKEALKEAVKCVKDNGCAVDECTDEQDDLYAECDFVANLEFE